VLRRLHDSPAERAVLAERGLRRVSERFAWPAVAQATVAQYWEAIGDSGAGGDSEAGGDWEAAGPGVPAC